MKHLIFISICIIMLFASLAADDYCNILWDDTHSLYPYGVPNFTTMISTLESTGHTVTTTLAVFNTAGFDVIIIGMVNNYYTESEKTMIQNWVANDGVLILMGEFGPPTWACNPIINDLLSDPDWSIHMLIADDNIHDAIHECPGHGDFIYMTDILPDPVTAGIDTVLLCDGSSLIISPPAVGFIHSAATATPPNSPAFAYENWGMGRIYLIGDNSWITDGHCHNLDNIPMFANMVGDCSIIPCPPAITWIECPVPCWYHSSCANQSIVFGINDTTGFAIETTQVWFTVITEHADGSVDTVYLPDESTSTLFPAFSDRADSILAIIFGTWIDGDSVTISMDSLYNENGCLTIS